MYCIGSGAGFSGDRTDAALPVVAEIAASGKSGAIIFETLGERTLALGQLAKRRNPVLGFEPLLEEIVSPILADCVAAGIVIVGNFGSANPSGAASVIHDLGKQQGLHNLKIAVVEGDDILGKIDLAQAERWDGDGRMGEPTGELIAINVYLGAQAIAKAISDGAQVVVTGRVADSALALGPLVAHFNWDWQDLDLMAAGTLVGHLLECGSQISGGFFADPGFKNVPEPENIGFPIAEVEDDGSFIITKPVNTGGVVDLRTVKEQLLYEIHDPGAYLTPDVTLDITEVYLQEVAENRVLVRGARGHTPSLQLKATVSYLSDWRGEAEISYAGPNALARADLAIDIIERRIRRRGIKAAIRADIMGLSSVFDSDDGALRQNELLRSDLLSDLRVRFAFVSTAEKEVRRAIQEVTALYCCGPAGGGGIRSSLSQRVHTHSYLIPRESAPDSYRFWQPSL